MTSQVPSAPPVGKGEEPPVLKISFPRNVLEAEIERVRKKFPRSYDTTARLLALARPVIEVVLLECGYGEELPRPAGTRGKAHVPAVALVLTHLLAQRRTAGSYRQCQRELDDHPAWLKAMGLAKAPDHTTLSKFRAQVGVTFFRHLLRAIVALLADFGLVHPGEDAIVDSAPVKASMNFPRANAGPQLDEARVRAFFGAVNFTPAAELVPVPTRGRRPAFAAVVLVRFLALEKLAGFLSRNQALVYLKRHPAIANALGIPVGKILPAAAITSFEQRAPPSNVLMQPVVEAITEFFDARDDYDDEDPLNFFFRASARGPAAAGPGC